MKLLPENLSFLVTFDNFFTSLNLLLYLGSKGIGATGTLRANRIVKFPIMVQKEMAKKHRGTMDHCYDSAKKIVVTRWNDNCVVTLASNCQVVNLVGKTKRYSRKKRKIIEVDKPYVVRYFNQNMCGVDRMDQNISFYRIPVHAKKWFQKRSCRYLPPKTLVSTTWGWLCWTPNSCCSKKACKSTWTNSLWWAGKLFSKQLGSKKMSLLWNEGQVHLWKVKCRIHIDYFSAYTTNRNVFTYQ